jgi:DNA-binding transcriptional regulator YiaG
MTADELAAAREAADLTVKQAAEFSGTPYRTWNSWERTGANGRRPPGIAFSWLALWVKQHQGS